MEETPGSGGILPTGKLKNRFCKQDKSTFPPAPEQGKGLNDLLRDLSTPAFLEGIGTKQDMLSVHASSDS